MAMMTRLMTRPMTSQSPFPAPPRTADTLSPMDAVSGAVAPKAPPMAFMSVPRANRPPVMDMKVYLKIQLKTTV